ncbi:MAG: NAD(+)/NADH kinase [Bacillota bacterium]
MPQLEKLGVRPLFLPEVAEKIGFPECGTIADEWRQGEIVIVMGGDGALLSAARLVYPKEIPICGVNLGHLGFLTEIEKHEIDRAVPRLFAGDFHTEPRMMLASSLYRNGELISSNIALNDMVISKGPLARMIRLETYIENELMFAYAADGIIIATPTGSTAYSLSAGGPILYPALEGIVLTPICAHAVFSRALVVRSGEKIRVVVRSHHHEVMFTADGQVGMKICPDDEITIEKAPHMTHLIRLQRRTFYEIIRQQYKEGRL